MHSACVAMGDLVGDRGALFPSVRHGIYLAEAATATSPLACLGLHCVRPSHPSATHDSSLPRMATDWRSKLGFAARLSAVTKMQVP